MVDTNSTCKSCVHNDVCRYAKDFEIICNSLMEVAKESVDKEYWQNLVDLKIRCRKYVMAPYQEVKSKQNSRTPLEFYYNDICKADVEKMREKLQNKTFGVIKPPDFMKTSVDMQEDKA